MSGPPPPPLPPPLKAPNHGIGSNKSFLHQQHQQFCDGNDEKSNGSTMVTNKLHEQQQNYQLGGGNENIENIDSDSGLEVVEEPTLRPSDLVRGNHNRSMSIISGEQKRKRKFRVAVSKPNLRRVPFTAYQYAKYRELCKKCLHDYRKF